MFLPASFAAALAMTISSTLCWGSFAITLKLAKGYRFELYYWDYLAGVVLITSALAFTLGSAAGGPTALAANLRAASAANLGYAAAAGLIFNFANELLLAGIAMVGLAVAYPIGIGLALVEGVVLSYAVQPQGNAFMLASGVAMAILAVILVGKAYGARRGNTTRASSKGGWVCAIAGVLMGTFSPLVAEAMTGAQPLTPYAVSVLFAAGCLVGGFVVNPCLMRKPLTGPPVGFASYRAAPATYHGLGMLGGAVWALGTVFNFVAAGVVGVAVSYAIGQASPLVAVLWGVFAWGEFRGANRRAWAFLTAMLLCYLCALTLIALASRV